MASGDRGQGQGTWRANLHPPAEEIIEAHIVSGIHYDIDEQGRVSVRGVRNAGPRIIEALAAQGYAVVKPVTSIDRKIVNALTSKEMDHAKRYHEIGTRSTDQEADDSPLPGPEAD